MWALAWNAAPFILAAVAEPQVFLSASDDWFFAITLEQQIAQTAVAPTLFLWRTPPIVVIGRHQNAWSEANVPALERDGVMLARRHSGGGAVFLDLGSTIFSFISPRRASPSKAPLETDAFLAKNYEVLAAALKKLGVESTKSGRNDLTINIDGLERKVSGSAFQHTRNASMHHGTLLVNADLEALGRYLTPRKVRLALKMTDAYLVVAMRHASWRHVSWQHTVSGLTAPLCACRMPVECRSTPHSSGRAQDALRSDRCA